ncbi:hypothetical protein DM860_002317 [Cuscuta australis]|uniref:Auxin-responsive protein n=1 Tax=Cuscuta australis TaxID=267555 RepID=A0A328D1T2_9ASTE|nr:hypothetical protein DM860_002317 [Cuscuta australis]
MMEPAAALGLKMGGGGGAVKDDAAELELGLSLGSGGSVGKMRRSSECGSSCGGGARILTAKDFPNGFPRVGPAAAAVSGMKRAADDPCVGSPPTASSQVVGWPPIAAYRMNTLANTNSQSKLSDDEQEDEVVEEAIENSKKKMSHGFVKVNMDGHPIGRKVDLIAHTSYKTLALTLEDMFFKSTPKTTNSTCRRGKQQKMVPSKLLDKCSSEFVLTYEDKDGDWMLVGDVPWGMFLSTVKRLRIMRTSESNGLGMDSHI